MTSGADERSPFPDTGVGNGGTDALYVDVAAMLDGGLPDPPSPVLLHRTDGRAIFYAGQVNLLFGDPESGKTMVAQAAAAEALMAGRRVAFIDIDHNGPEATVCRFIDLDVPESTLRDPHLFRYAEPEDKPHLLAVVDDLKTWRPAVAIVDSIGELLPMLGLSSNSPDDFTTGHTRVLKGLAMGGACVLAVDHLAKNSDSRAQGSTGTAAKRRAIGGVAIRVTVEEQFAPGRGGSAYLQVNKDRHGGLRKHCPATAGKESIAGLFRIHPDPTRIVWSLEAPTGGEVPKSEQAAEADVAALAALDPAATSVRDVKRRMHWNSERASRTLAALRSRRSPSVPEERGTPEEAVVPVFPLAVSGNGEREGEGRHDDQKAS